MAEAGDRVFVLGLGAQKAGTTWLHAHLAGLEGTEFGFDKEYHVFDALHLPEARMVHRERVERAQAVLAARPGAFRAHARLWRLIAFEADPELYVDYFAGLLSRPGIRVTGDITPAYSGLGAEVLRGIRERFAARGIRVVPVFLMRDPVERCWSAVRMTRRLAREADPAHVFELTEEQAVRRYFRSRQAEIRTRYDRTLAAMARVFAPEESFVGLYETLFSEAETARLARLLGLAPRAPDLAHRPNASAKDRALPDRLAAEIARHYAPAYAAAAGRVGRERLAELWPSAAHLGAAAPAGP